MKTILFLLLSVLGNSFFAQSCSPSVYRAAKGHTVLPHQGSNEKPVSFNEEVLTYINEMRADPKAFYDKYIPAYIRQKQDRFTAQYTRSLKTAMYQAPSLPLFKTNDALEKVASLQARYLAKFDGRKLTHDQGSIDFAERMKRANLHCLAENLYADDNPRALSVVIDLLIDQHVPSFGHRKNLMNPIYTSIGIVSNTPKGGRTIVVMDFGCQ